MKTTPTRDLGFNEVLGQQPQQATDGASSRLPTRRQVAGSLAHISANPSPEQAGRPRSDRASTFRVSSAPEGRADSMSDASRFVEAASSVRGAEGLQNFLDEVVASAKASAAANAGASLDTHCRALEELADPDRVLGRPWREQVDILRKLSAARGEMPLEIGPAGEARLNTAIRTVRERAINARTDVLVGLIDSAEMLEEVLQHAETDYVHSQPDSLRDLFYASFLEAAVDRVGTFEPDELARGHAIISDAIVSPPPGVASWATDGADRKLSQLAADKLLPPDVIASYQVSERLAQAAASLHELTELHALLSKPGIAGPQLPSNLPGEHDGNMGLMGRARPEPLADFADRVGSFTPVEANLPAFSAIIDKTDSIEPAGLRVTPLRALAAAASRLASDAERKEAYHRVLTSFDTLLASRRATSEQCASVLNALHEAVAERMQPEAGPAERSALVQLRQANEKLPPGFQLIL